MEPKITIAQMAGMLFPLLFNMMGPIGVIPLFAAVTTRLQAPERAAAARRAALLSLMALAVAVFIGASVLDAWGISRAALIMAAGLIVTLSALQPMLMRQTPAQAGEAGAAADVATMIAFPGIVSPKAVAVLIIFVAYFPTMDAKLAVFALAAAMLLLDWIGMRAAPWFMQKIGMVPLLVLGAVFGVLQVALGVEMLANGWQAFVAP